jgi:Bacteriophage minor capsid protein
VPGLLSHAPAQILRRVLVAQGHGADPPAGPWPCYCPMEPDQPDNCVTVAGTAGTDHGRTMIDGERQEFHGVQVRVRASDPLTGYAKARALAVALDGLLRVAVTLGTTPYLLHAVTRTSDVLELGTDAPRSKRHLYTINARFTVRQTIGPP